MNWTFDRGQLLTTSDGAARYEQIAAITEAAIDRGELRPGERLPTVRALASQLGVSGASVAVAYGLLARHGRVHAQVGRGTFVSLPAPDGVGQSRDGNVVRELPRRAGDSSRALL